MSKEFRNMDQLFQSELGGLTKKAPASVKLKVNKAIGARSSKITWILGFSGVAIILVISFYQLDSSKPFFGKNEMIAPDLQPKIEPSLNEQSSVLVNQSTESIHNGENSVKSEPSNIFDIQKEKNKPNFSSTHNTSPVYTTSENSNDLDKQQKDVLVNQTFNNLKKEKNDVIQLKSSNEDINNLNNQVLADNNNDLALNKPQKEMRQPIVDSIRTENLILDVDSSATANHLASIDSTLEDPDIDFDKNTDSHSPWFFNISTGINVKKSAFETTIAADESAYGNQLKDKMGHSALFDVSYRLRNSLTFGAGIGYTSMYESYNYYKADQIVVDTNYISSYYLDSLPDTASSTGWTYFTDSIVSPDYVYGAHEYYNANGTNSTTYLNIPIRFGTQLIFDKWRLDLFVGGRFNLLLASKSTYIENGQLFSTKNQGFKNSYFDLTFGASAHYEIYNNLFLSGIVRYRPPLNSAYYSTQITNRFQNAYIGIGLGFNL